MGLSKAPANFKETKPLYKPYNPGTDKEIVFRKSN